MKPGISLKWFAALSFLVPAILLIIGYSILSIQFFFKGMDRMMAGGMANALKSYITAIPAPERETLTAFSGYLISREWEQMPEEIRLSMEEPGQPGQLKVEKKNKTLGPPRAMVFAMRVSFKAETYYIGHVASHNEASPLIGQDRHKNLRTLISISLLTALGIAGFIFILLKLVERPVKSMGRWARSLDAKNLNDPAPDFVYPELNELARMIRDSLSSAHESLDREHRFLRHSSHELRTPISIIRNNVELLKKLVETSENAPPKAPDKALAKEEQKQRGIGRIDRASLTMKHLTQTLLWLSRDEETRLPESDLDLESLVKELVDEAGYLLRDKEVSVSLETEPSVLKLPVIPARIVTGNLIRNAFQHTWHGGIQITQTRDGVEIKNDIIQDNQTDKDLGFGLGLQLTRQLCDKLNWPYTSSIESGRHRARVVFR